MKSVSFSAATVKARGAQTSSSISKRVKPPCFGSTPSAGRGGGTRFSDGVPIDIGPEAMMDDDRVEDD